MKFTFDVSKCDSIFDELLSLGHNKTSYVIPLLEELKRRAYCQFHNSSSHATNDCNIFRRQVQPAINEGRLTFPEMKIDKAPFPVHTLISTMPRCLFGWNKPTEPKERMWSLVKKGRRMLTTRFWPGK